MIEKEFNFWDGNEMVMWDDVSEWQVEHAFNPDTAIWEPLQYIGKKDKNGRKIFFGDILQTENLTDTSRDLWKRGDYGFAICGEPRNNIGVVFSNWSPTEDEESVYNFNFVTVIGNKFENPELLQIKFIDNSLAREQYDAAMISGWIPPSKRHMTCECHIEPPCARCANDGDYFEEYVTESNIELI